MTDKGQMEGIDWKEGIGKMGQEGKGQAMDMGQKEDIGKKEEGEGQILDTDWKEDIGTTGQEDNGQMMDIEDIDSKKECCYLGDIDQNCSAGNYWLQHQYQIEGNRSFDIDSKQDLVVSRPIYGVLSP